MQVAVRWWVVVMVVAIASRPPFQLHAHIRTWALPPLQRGRGLADRHDRSEGVVVGDAEAPGPSIISSRQICPLSPRPAPLQFTAVHHHPSPIAPRSALKGPPLRGGIDCALTMGVRTGSRTYKTFPRWTGGREMGLVAPWFWSLGHGSLGCRCAWW